jgi:beta-propeller uncharacterized protein DUF5122
MPSTLTSFRRAGAGRLATRRVVLMVVGMVALLAASTLPAGAFANISKFHTPTWGTNMLPGTVFASRVWSIVENDGIAYIGGEFDTLAPSLKLAGALDTTSGLPQPGFPAIGGGLVQVAIPDDAGGWYIGGDFTEVDGVTRRSLARVRSDGRVDTSFNPNFPPALCPCPVYALAKRGPRLYVGGSFSKLVGTQQSRNNIALVSASSGVVDGAWNPDANGVVRALAVSPDQSRIYAAGDFTAMKGGLVPRNHLAAIAAEGTGEITPWNPPATGSVTAMAVSRDNFRVYAAGSDVLNGSPLAAFDSGGGAPIPGWNPGAGGAVRSIALARDDTTLFAGGDFTSLGGQARQHVAAVDTATGTVDRSWNPGANNQVNTVSISEDGTRLFLGGTFTQVRGRERNKLAAIDTATGALTTWNPNSNGDIASLSVSGGQVYAGGNFSDLGFVPRTRLAAIDLTNGNATAWHPTVSVVPGSTAPALVQAVALSSDRKRLFVAGKFDSICNGANNKCLERTNLAALDLASGDPDPTFEPGVLQGIVRSMAVYDGRVYVGGDFGGIRVSKSDLTDKNRPDANTGPLCDASKPNGGRCWDRSMLAAFDARTGELDEGFVPPVAIDPGMSGQGGKQDSVGVGAVKGIGIAKDGSKMWVAGTFSGAVIPGAPQACATNGALRCVAGMYVLNRATGQPTPWQPQINIPIFDVEVWDGNAAGDVIFTAGGGAGGKIQRFQFGGPGTPVWQHIFDGDSTAVDTSGDTVYSGGHYDFVDKASKRKHASAFDLNGVLAEGFDPELNTPEGPYEVRVVPGRSVLYGGDFSTVNRRPQPGFAMFEGRP